MNFLILQEGRVFFQNKSSKMSLVFAKILKDLYKYVINKMFLTIKYSGMISKKEAPFQSWFFSTVCRTTCTLMK